jgi:hypothetical protein
MDRYSKGNRLFPVGPRIIQFCGTSEIILPGYETNEV